MYVYDNYRLNASAFIEYYVSMYTYIPLLMSLLSETSH